MAKWVYSFGAGHNEGRADMRNLLGGKGANLAEMASIGLPVPPGFTVTTEVCTYYYAHKHTYPAELRAQVSDALDRVEAAVGAKFGDTHKPLLVSVRSGARVSMPGMMDTVLNLGLNDATVDGLAGASGDARFAWDSYRRFIQMFGSVVLGVDHHRFEEIIEHVKLDQGAAEDTDLSLSIHRTGYRVEYAPAALAYTEAPETYRQLARQRFRWAFGTLQCVWKHRDMTFNPRFKALGLFSLPGIWFFQVILVAFSPVIDLIFLQALFAGRGGDILPYFLAFLLCDLAIAAVAVAIEGLPLRMALRIIPQRFVYRPLLSYVVWRSLLQAVRGAWVGWNKLPRTASVSPA